MHASSGKGFKSFYFIFVLALFLLLCFIVVRPSVNQSQVWAASAHLFHPGIGEATIDGNIEVDEWAAADSYSLLMYNSISSTHTGTLYVMQSQTDLYLGFTVDDDEFTTGFISGLYGDTLQFEFDDNNSGSLFEIGENKLSIFAADPWYRDAFVVNETGSSNTDESQPGGATHGAGMSGRHGSLNHYELRFPLCSGDAYDFCLFPGNILGLRVKYYDVEVTLDYKAHLYPGVNNDNLVTIEIIGERNVNYLALIMK